MRRTSSAWRHACFASKQSSVGRCSYRRFSHLCLSRFLSPLGVTANARKQLHIRPTRLPRLPTHLGNLAAKQPQPEPKYTHHRPSNASHPAHLPLAPPNDKIEECALLRPASLQPPPPPPPPPSRSQRSLPSLQRDDDDAKLLRLMLPPVEQSPAGHGPTPWLLRRTRRCRRRPPPSPPPGRRGGGKSRGHHQVTARASTDRMRQPTALNSCRSLRGREGRGGGGR